MAKDRYVGVVPPIVTPVDEFERVDEAALRGIVRRCKDVGLHGVFVAGSNGECMALTQAERNRAIRIVLDEVWTGLPGHERCDGQQYPAGHRQYQGAGGHGW